MLPSIKFKIAFFASAFAFMLVCSANAQELNYSGTLDNLMLFKLREKSTYNEDLPKDYTGTPYSNDAFIPGEVQVNNDVFSDVPLRYDISNDLIEFKKDEMIYIIDPSEQIIRVEFGDYKFVVRQYVFKGQSVWGYLNELSSGEASLFARKMVSYREAKLPQALQSESTPAKFQPLPNFYYYQISDSELVKIESLKNMIGGFPDRQDQLTSYSKKEKISHRKSEHLIKLIEYYNSL